MWNDLLTEVRGLYPFRIEGRPETMALVDRGQMQQVMINLIKNAVESGSLVEEIVVGIEPSSMTAVFCANTADRTAETWENQLAPFDRLEFAISDAAKGIVKAVSDLAQARREDPEAPALEHGLDVFHTAMEAHRVPAGSWRRAEAAWEKAEAAEAEVAAAKRRGVAARGPARTARARAPGSAPGAGGSDGRSPRPAATPRCCPVSARPRCSWGSRAGR